MFWFIIFLFCSTLLEAKFDHFSYKEDLHFIDNIIFQAYEMSEITEEEFPKSYEFLENLIQKYPNEFKEVTFYYSKGTVPFAGCNVIGLPYQWLLELEADIAIVKKWSEWVLLHEAGHIHHKHVKVLTSLQFAQLFFSYGFMLSFINVLINGLLSDETIQAKYYGLNREDIKSGTLAFIGLTITSYLATNMYSKYIAEPQADDFAVDKCDDKEVLQAGINFLENVGLDNLAYPSTEDRISKIEKTISFKFN